MVTEYTVMTSQSCDDVMLTCVASCEGDFFLTVPYAI